MPGTRFRHSRTGFGQWRQAALKAVSVVPALCGAIAMCEAGMISLDIGPRGSAAAPGWESWPVPHGDGNGPLTHAVASASFDTDGFRVTIGPPRAVGCRTGPHCTGWSAGIIEESVFTHAEHPMVIRFEGLNAGTYRLLLWFNDSRGYEWPPLTLSTTDARGKDRTLLVEQPQTAATDTRHAAAADVIVHANGKDAVSLTARIPPVQKTYVFLSALEIVVDEALEKPLHPFPAHNALGLPLDVSLSWHASPRSESHDIWVGSDPDALRKRFADIETHTAKLSGLNFGETVYWRVDTRCEGRVVRGPTWRFKTRTGKAARPLPIHGDRDVDRSPRLSWRAPAAIETFRVYTGSRPDNLVPIPEPVTGSVLKLPECAWGQTVCWRVDSQTPHGVVTGDVWRFQVDRGEPRHPEPPHGASYVPSDTTLSWVCPRRDITFDVWMGKDADNLKRAATGLTTPRLAPKRLPGRQVFWQVTAGDEASDVWHFSTEHRMVLEDGEDYAPDRRLADVWDDRRAAYPRIGPLLRLSNDRCRSLLIAVPGGKRLIDCPSIAHPDWTLPSISHIELKIKQIRGHEHTGLAVYVVDREGKSSRQRVPLAENDWGSGRWSTVRLPLSAFNGVSLERVARFGLDIETPEPAEIQVDDICLTASGDDAPRVVPRLRTGSLTSCPGARPAPELSAAAPASRLNLRCDICIVGGGSGGIGAALAAARQGAQVILVERQKILGGTSTSGGISNWEPGPGCSIAREIYERLKRRGHAVISDRKRYDQTLTRASRGHIQFEPQAFHDVVSVMLAETGVVRTLLNTTCVTTTVDPDVPRMASVTVVDQDGQSMRIQAHMFVDCTGGAYLCQAAGCDTMLGVEPRDRFDEPSAPAVAADRLNAIELVYRIRPSSDPTRQPLPDGTAPRRGGAAWPLPSGDRFVNTCGGLAPGFLLIQKGYAATRAELEVRALAHWHWLQKSKYPGYEFDRFSPMLAIRESHRVVGEYILTEHDLTAGIGEQLHRDIVAIADHPMDTHGAGGGLGKVAAPYGIPFRCLVPEGDWRNLLVACRGASFSHIAASSCRLSRTMIALGHAAGLAAAQCANENKDLNRLDVSAIQATLSMPPE